MSQSREVALRSLLRPRRRGAADALPDLSPLGATAGVGEWGFTWELPGEPWIPPVTDYVMWAGWLAWRVPTDPAWEPARVYTDAWLQGSLAGDGTPIPGSTPARSEHLMGRAAVHPSQVCEDDRPVPTWPDSPPELDGDDSYLYPGTQPTAVFARQIWVGEARGVDQCIRGAERSWVEVVPIGWSTDPRELMIAWIDDALLLIRARPAGVDCIELGVPADLACLLPWLLMAGAVLGVDGLRWVRGWIYAYASAPAEATVHALLGADAMEDFYADGAASLHPGCGWQGLWQPAITDPWQAVQTVTWIETDGAYASRSGKLAVSSGGGGYAATLTMSPGVRWGGARFRFWASSGSGLMAAIQPPGTEVNHDSMVLVYQYTTVGGGIREVYRAPQYAAVTISYGSLPPWPVIGGSGDWEGYGGSMSTGGVGGWILSGGIEATTTVVISDNTSKNSVSVYPLASWHAKAITSWPGLLSGPGCADWGPKGYGYCGSAGSFTVLPAGAHIEKRVTAASSGTGGATLLFLSDDAGVMIGAYQSFAAGTTRFVEVDTSGFLHTASGNYDRIQSSGCIPGAACGRTPGNGGNWQGGAAFSGTTDDGVVRTYGQGYNPDAAQLPAAVPAAELNEKKMWIAPSSGATHNVSSGGWDAFYAQSAGTSVSGPAVAVTWGGQETLSLISGGPLTVPAGMAAAAAAWPQVAPMGPV